MATSTHPREHLLAGLPLTERRLPLAGVATAVLEGGVGPPVVVLHGPAGNATHWLRVLPDLIRTHRVIAPDLPGQGASEAPELDADRVLAWLGELIERTCVSPPALVGYGLGGAIAARFAADHGDRVVRLVLVDALGLAEFAPAPAFGSALNAFLADPTEHTHDGLWERCALDLDRLRRQMGERWEPFRAYNVDGARAPSVMSALGRLMAWFGLPAIPSAHLARIAVPTTLIWGRHDLATPVSVAAATSARHGWWLDVIEDSADDPPIEQPAAFLRALRAALVDTRALTDFKGELIHRGDPGYDDLRKVFNGMIDRRPALIARCTDARDVSAAVRFARDHRLPVSVYGGGHNVTGNAVCDDGVTIDLRPMKGIDIHPDVRTCRAEAGLTRGELDAATQAHGLAVTGGRVSSTGVGGLVLGGGPGCTSTSSGTRARTASSPRSGWTAMPACGRSRTATTPTTSSGPARTSGRAVASGLRVEQLERERERAALEDVANARRTGREAELEDALTAFFEACDRGSAGAGPLRAGVPARDRDAHVAR